MKINKSVVIFLVLTFIINWSIAGVMYLLNIKMRDITGILLGVLYMFIPMIVAIFVKKVVQKEEIKQSLGISFKWNRWFFIAWFLPPILSLVAFLLSLLFPDISFSPEMQGMFERFKDTVSEEDLALMKEQMKTLPVHPIILAFLQGMIAGITINAIAGFGEELGWRGFLLYEFREMSFWKSSILIGSIWGIWHAPLILQGHNYPQNPEIGAIIFIIWCILLSPIFNYIRIKSRSVVAVSIMHGTINATYGLSIILIKGGNDLLVGLTGLAGFITLILAVICFYIYDTYISKEQIMKLPIINVLQQNVLHTGEKNEAS